MIKITGHIIKAFNRFKYCIVIVAGVLYVGFVGEDSFMKRFEYEHKISELREEIKQYEERYEADTKLLRELRRNPGAIAQVARERYFMKTDDEDIFVLSDDEQPKDKKSSNETVE